ncbi:HK97 family phage prohead protease [Vibrio mytili]|uniref:HK97 family phage prohead protease n=1 Tax=Vibrio mytili TaxID=50718 RepID=UPI002F3FB248
MSELEKFKRFLEVKAADVEFKEAETESGSRSFRGYAAVFGNVDTHGDIIERQAFDVYLLAVENGTASLPDLLYMHEQEMVPVGKITRVWIDEVGLLVEAELTPNMSLADDLYAALKHGTIDGLSIGYYTIGAYVDEYGYRHLLHLDLDEVSIVRKPSNDKTRIDLLSVKSALDDAQSLREVEKLLKQKGLTNAETKSVISAVSRLKELELKQAEQTRIETKQAANQIEAAIMLNALSGVSYQ